MNNSDIRKLQISYDPIMEYGTVWELQKESVHAIDSGEQPERLILLQHPPTYTIGSQNHPEHLLLDHEQLEKKESRCLKSIAEEILHITDPVSL